MSDFPDTPDTPWSDMPFGFDPSQLFGMLESSGPVNWEVAGQVAPWVALTNDEGQQVPEAPINPEDVQQFEELSRAAQTHVVAATELAATFTSETQVIGRVAWAELHLKVLRNVLETFATRLAETMKRDEGEIDPTDPLADPMSGQMSMAGIIEMLAPVMLGVQSGSMIGFLAQHALGRYDLPLPANDKPTLCFVLPNIDAFEDGWSLPRNDLRFYITLHEVIHAAERSVPWVREALLNSATEYIQGYEIDAATLEDQFGTLDPENPNLEIVQDPQALISAMQSPAQADAQKRLQMLVSVLEGYADIVLSRVGSPLIESFGMIHEAMQRHRVERGQAERFIETLLGLSIGQEVYDQGQAFCEGVIERADLTGLNRLWEGPHMLPTPAELEAPGLWLARIELPEA